MYSCIACATKHNLIYRMSTFKSEDCIFRCVLNIAIIRNCCCTDIDFCTFCTDSKDSGCKINNIIIVSVIAVINYVSINAIITYIFA